jgi:hypothetical protein
VVVARPKDLVEAHRLVLAVGLSAREQNFSCREAYVDTRDTLEAGVLCGGRL